MGAVIVIGIIIFIIALIVYLEYKNEKAYQEKRRQEKKKKKLTPKVTRRPTPVPQKRETQKEYSLKAEKKKPAAETNPEIANISQSAKTKPPSEVPKKKEKQAAKETLGTKEKPSIELPRCKYPKFNYSRLIAMGLSEEEAHEFIWELIPQILEQIPLIEKAMEVPDFHKMERLTHSIKGSSTTIGTGGVSDLLIDYNTYLKTGEELVVAKEYQRYLKYYLQKLQEQFPKKS